MDKNVKIPRVITLSDIPAESDVFGPHQKVATAICNVIKTESGNKAIALAGSWGSGKSTVVKLLEKQIDKKSETIFVFDAWSHQGDPLRRSFLEGLIDHLEGINWCSPQRWKSKKEEISRRREETTVLHKPVLTLFGKIYACTILAIPIGVTLINKNGLCAEVVRGIPLALAPLLGGFFGFCYMRIMEYLKGDKELYKDESFWSALKSKDIETVRTVTSKTPDPTSLEFNAFFSEILTDTLNDKGRKLIIVMDNLDRIAPNTALELWSTMRIFFDQTRYGHDRARDNFWLIVPFDSKAIGALWSDDKSRIDELAKNFIDKSFQLTFHVPPPVLSDWKNFLLSQLKEAFPSHDSNEFHNVYRLYLLSKRKTSPRDIKIFVNEVGEICRQWGFEIPFVLQALYVLKRNGDNIEDQILNDKLIDDGFKNIIGISDWQKYLSAIHFNVPIQKALQVLVGSDIDRAFAKGDAKSLDRFKNVPAFEEVCENLISNGFNGWAKNEPTTIALTAVVLGDLQMKDSPSGMRAWSDLRKGCLKVSSWKGLDSKSAVGVVRLLQSSPENEVSSLSAAIVSGLVSLSPVEKDGQDVIPEEWGKHATDAIAVILECISALGQEATIKKHFKVPGSAPSYVEIFRRMGANRPPMHILKYFLSVQDETSIIRSLEEKANSGTLVEEHAPVVESLSSIGYKNWQPFASAAENRLHTQHGLNAGQAFGLIDSLLNLSLKAGNASAKTVLTNCVNQGKIAHHLHRANSEKNVGFQASSFFAIMLYNPQGNNNQNHGNSGGGYSIYNQFRSDPYKQPDLVIALSKKIDDFGYIEWAVNNLDDANIGKILHAVLSELLFKQKINNRITPAFFIESRKLFEEKFSDQELEKIILELSRESDLVDKIIEAEFDTDLRGIYKILSQFKEHVQNGKFADFLIKGLQALEQDSWKEQINEELELISVGLSLIKAGYNLDLEANFSDPLFSKYKNFRSKDEAPNEFAQDWPLIVKFLEKSFYESFISNAVTDLITHPEQSISVPFKLLRDGLIGSSALSDKADDIFRLVAAQIIERDEIKNDEIMWLIQVSENQEALNNIKSSTKKQLIKRIAGVPEEKVSEELGASLKRLRQLLEE